MPRFHHWHHAVEKEAVDSNFAVHPPMIDRWFDTHYLPGDSWPSGYGVAGVNAPDGYFRRMVWPLRRRDGGARGQG